MFLPNPALPLRDGSPASRCVCLQPAPLAPSARAFARLAADRVRLASGSPYYVRACPPSTYGASSLPSRLVADRACPAVPPRACLPFPPSSARGPAGALPSFRLYIDEQALDNACARLRTTELNYVRPWEHTDAHGVWRHADDLLDVLSSAECVGSEQVRRLLLLDDTRQSEARLARALLRAFYKLLWEPATRGSRLRIHVLRGSRAERVADARLNNLITPVYEPRQPSSVRGALLEYLADEQWIRATDLPSLRLEAARRSNEYAERSHAELKKGLVTPTVPFLGAATL